MWLASTAFAGCVGGAPHAHTDQQAGNVANAATAAGRRAADSGNAPGALALPSGILPPGALPGVPSCLPGSSAESEGCPCRAGELGACWTGAPADRQRGSCHDGMHKCVGSSDAEFGSWGPCEGQELACGDAGTADCGCVPGSEIQCDEDCSVSIFCSLSATKTCLPDGSWGPCHEMPGRPSTTAILGDAGVSALFADGGVGQLLAPDGGIGSVLVSVPVNLAPLLGDAGIGVLTTGPCRSIFFGCAALLGQKEQWWGDCTTAFTCQKPPQ